MEQVQRSVRYAQQRGLDLRKFPIQSGYSHIGGKVGQMDRMELQKTQHRG
jgi:hypothetical protein